MQKNEIFVELLEFNAGMKLFKNVLSKKSKAKKQKIEKAILAFDNGFLTIECNDITAVMNAKGEWHGKAEFSENVINALSLIPSNASPVVISYCDEKLKIDRMSVACDWTPSSQGIIDKLNDPSLLDIIAMWRTQPVLELKRSGIDKQYKLAQRKLKTLLASSAKRLIEFEITEEDISDLIEQKIKTKIDSFK